MGYALKIYEAFREYGEEKARILAEAFEELEKRYPQILDMATKKDLTETELKLTKEIEQVRKEMKEMELRLQGEIEQVRLEVEQVRLEVEQVRREISETKASFVKWMFLFWTGQIIAFAGLLKLMLR
jgi:methyl-accepting chemotaxis protein